MKKKLIALGTVAVLSVSLAACGSSDKKDDSASKDATTSTSQSADTQSADAQSADAQSADSQSK